MPTLQQYSQLVATAKIPVEGTLLQNVTGNTNGSWKFAGSDAPTLVTIEAVNGSFTATVEIHGSTQPAAPADTDNTRVILLTVVNSPSQSFSVPQGYRWIKARVTGWASGTIYAGLVSSGS